MTSDSSIRGRINALIEEEKALRAERGTDKLAAIETELDQCWDLLRQRQAAREFGQDPDAAHVRPAEVVESYLS
jgi:hypothetical protein